MVRVGHSYLHYHLHFFTGARREERRHPAADGGRCAGGPGGEQPQRLRQVGHPHNHIYNVYTVYNVYYIYISRYDTGQLDTSHDTIMRGGNHDLMVRGGHEHDQVGVCGGK